MTITAIIPCYNEEEYVGQLLQDLSNQTDKLAAIFVVDCDSQDKTIERAKAFSKQLPIKILRSDYRSAASARNIGANEAKTDYLLFLDADMRLPIDFIHQLKLCARAKNADFVSPKFISEGHHPWDHIVVWFINFWVRFYHMRFKRKPAGIGGAMFVSQKLHKLIGGYSPQRREFDDVDYFMRMWGHSILFGYANKAVATVSNRRHKEQGRFASALQNMSDHNFFVRHFVRPLMKLLGIKPKWHDLE